MAENLIEGRPQKTLAELGGDLQIITQEIVVPHLGRLDADLLGVARLQTGDDGARFVAQSARLVEIALSKKSKDSDAIAIGELVNRAAPPHRL